MTMITPSYLGETIEYSSLHACRSTLEDPTWLAVWQHRRIKSTAGKLAQCTYDMAGITGTLEAEERAHRDTLAARDEAHTERDAALRQVAELKQQVQSQATAASRPDDLTDIQLKILRVLYSQYPSSMPLRHIAQKASQSFAICETHMGGLVRGELARPVRGSYTEEGGYALTPGGRDYCIAKFST